MPHTPLVSIVIPVYNGERFVAQALDSALAQTFANCEIVVHDNDSTDGTHDILSRYTGNPHLRIKVSDRNLGMVGGWNQAVSMAQGDYIKFLAADDLLSPTCVAELVQAAQAHPQAALITCQRKFMDEKGRVVKKMGFAGKNTAIDGKTHAHWILTTLRENKIGEPTAVLYPRSLIKRAGQYDPTFSQFADFEYWIRLLEFGDLVYVHKPLCSFRLHEGSNTSAAIRDGRFITETFALIRKYYKEPSFVKAFSLTNHERIHITRQKTLDTLKNIKNLVLAGQIGQALRYTSRLIGAIATNGKSV